VDTAGSTSFRWDPSKVAALVTGALMHTRWQPGELTPMPARRRQSPGSPEITGGSEAPSGSSRTGGGEQSGVLGAQSSSAAASGAQQHGAIDGSEHVPSVEKAGTEVSQILPPGSALPETFKEIKQNLNALQHRQLDIQARELEVRWAEIELKQRDSEIAKELTRLAIEYANDNEKARHSRLADAEKARQNMAHRGQTAAIWLAYPILLGSFIFGLILVILTIVGIVGPALGGTLGALFVGGPLLAATAKIIQSFTSGKASD
jgi:hypothetical protein